MDILTQRMERAMNQEGFRVESLSPTVSGATAREVEVQLQRQVEEQARWEEMQRIGPKKPVAAPPKAPESTALDTILSDEFEEV